MERTGTITAVSGDTLEVTFCRPGDCEKCHACIGGEKKHVLLVKGEGHVGDAAVVSLPEQTVVKASALAYLCRWRGCSSVCCWARWLRRRARRRAVPSAV